jgi:hypothetical protein
MDEDSGRKAGEVVGGSRRLEEGTREEGQVEGWKVEEELKVERRDDELFMGGTVICGGEEVGTRDKRKGKQRGKNEVWAKRRCAPHNKGRRAVLLLLVPLLMRASCDCESCH